MAEKKILKGVKRADLVGAFPLENKDNVIVIRQNVWKGEERLDIRLFWHPKGEPAGVFVPTKRGVSIPMSDAEKFVELCTAALDKYEDAQEEEEDEDSGDDA